MPGLGIIFSDHPSGDDARDLKTMVQAMAHESFYSSGHYINEALGVYVGWTCLEGAYCDCMPIENAAGDRLLFFYGEHHGSSSEVPVEGNKHDAREVLEIFERYGASSLSRLNGWYHGVLVDLTRKEAVLFNDRYGMQRLYQHKEANRALFASEAKALLRVRKAAASLDERGLGEFLTCNCVLENRTLFRGVTVVPGGSVLRFKGAKSVSTTSSFAPQEWENQTPLEEGEFREAACQMLPRVMRRYLRGEQPLGMSLTGGFDTRVIMAYLAEATGPIASYTFGGSYRDCFDVRIARKVAAQCKTSHEVISLEGDFFSDFPALAEKTVYLSDGNLGAFNAYELYLNKRARDIAPVRITGSYGSEVIKGARAFKANAPTPGLLQPGFAEVIAQSLETFEELSSGNPISFSVFKQGPWQYFNRLAIEQSQVTIRTPFMDNELVGLMYRAPVNLPRQSFYLDLIRHGNPVLTQLHTDTGNSSLLRGWLMQLLFKADYCYKSGMPQWLEQVHHALGPFQPEKLLAGVHRLAHPRIWIRNQLAPYLKEVLLDPGTLGRPYFRRHMVEKMVLSHTNGTANHTDDLERILTLELTCRMFTDSFSTASQARRQEAPVLGV